VRYAARHPEHPAKLILQSTTASWDLDRTVNGFRERGGEEAATAAKAFFTEPGYDTLPAFMQHGLPAYSPAPLDPVAMGRSVVNVELQYEFFRDFSLDLSADVAAVRCPTLVLGGVLDPITPLSSAEEIVAALSPGLATFEVFEHSGHFIADTEPERLFAAIRSFVAS